MPPQLDPTDAAGDEDKGIRDGSPSPHVTSTTLVTGGTTIHSRNGTVTVNFSGPSPASSPPSTSFQAHFSPPTNTTPSSSLETCETPCDVYRRHMELRKKGRRALWAPEPCLQLPLQYRRGGTQVGDVGIITQDGDFDFMFNICGTDIQSSYDLADLPVGFAHICPPRREKELSIRAEHHARDTLTSQGVSKRIQSDGEFVFTCNQQSGAILVLPHGSVTEKLRNYSRFQKYYAQNAEAWYAFALATRGPDVQNGDLHLVYGCEKATGWGITAFDNPHRGKQPAEHRFRNMGGDWRTEAGTPYAWEHTDDAIGKVGPRDSELEELGASRDAPLRNQTLFILSINTTLQEEHWKRIIDAASMDVSTDFGSSESTSSGSISPGPSFTSTNPSTQNQIDATLGITGQGGPQYFRSMSTTRKQPSQVLNAYLLNHYPEAKVAAIASEVWSHVEDECLDAPEMLIAAVLSAYSTVVDVDGLATFVNNADHDTTSSAKSTSGSAAVRQISSDLWSPPSTSPISARRDNLTPFIPANIPCSIEARRASTISSRTSMSTSFSTYLHSSSADGYPRSSPSSSPSLEPMSEGSDRVQKHQPTFAINTPPKRPTTAGSRHSGQRAQPSYHQREPSQPAVPSLPYFQVPNPSSLSMQTRQSSRHQVPSSPFPFPSTSSVPGRPRSVATISSSRSNALVDVLAEEFISVPSVVTDRRPIVAYAPSGEVRAGTLAGLLAHLVEDNGERFRNTLFIASYNFLSPEMLVEQLTDHFDARPSDDQETVIRILTAWMEARHMLTVEPPLLENVRCFAQMHLFHTPDSNLKRNLTMLRDAVQRRSEANVPPAILSASLSGATASKRVRFPMERLALLLSMLEDENFRQLNACDFLSFRRFNARRQTEHLTAFLETHHNISAWVTDTILAMNTKEGRAKEIKYFIKVARECKRLGNLSTHAAIALALTSWLDERPLRGTLRLLESKYRDRRDELRDFIIPDPLKEGLFYSNYRKCLREIGPDHKCIPWLEPHLEILATFFSSHPPVIVSEATPLLNFERYSLFIKKYEEQLPFIPLSLPYDEKAEGNLETLRQLMKTLSFPTPENLQQRRVAIELEEERSRTGRT